MCTVRGSPNVPWVLIMTTSRKLSLRFGKRHIMYFNLCKHFVDNIPPIHNERGFCLPWGGNDNDNDMMIFKLFKYQSNNISWWRMLTRLILPRSRALRGGKWHEVDLCHFWSWKGWTDWKLEYFSFFINNGCFFKKYVAGYGQAIHTCHIIIKLVLRRTPIDILWLGQMIFL